MYATSCRVSLRVYILVWDGIRDTHISSLHIHIEGGPCLRVLAPRTCMSLGTEDPAHQHYPGWHTPQEPRGHGNPGGGAPWTPHTTHRPCGCGGGRHAGCTSSSCAFSSCPSGPTHTHYLHTHGTWWCMLVVVVLLVAFLLPSFSWDAMPCHAMPCHAITR